MALYYGPLFSQTLVPLTTHDLGVVYKELQVLGVFYALRAFLLLKGAVGLSLCGVQGLGFGVIFSIPKSLGLGVYSLRKM